MSSEYIVGTVTGIVATGFGFLLSTFYEENRRKKEVRVASQKTISLLINELKDNLEIAQNNLNLVIQNEISLNQNSFVINSLALFQDSGWRLSQANGFCTSIGNDDFKFLAETYLRLSYGNAQINARENYRTTNISELPFSRVLAGFDKTLKESFDYDTKQIEKAILKLQEIQKKQSIPRKFTWMPFPQEVDRTLLCFI